MAVYRLWIDPISGIVCLDGGVLLENTMTRRDAVSIGLAVAVLLSYSVFVRVVAEDAYISFRYAANLVDQGEFVFNMGERVEGYTNTLWTLLLAAAHALQLPLPTCAMWLGVAFAIGSLVYTYRFVAAYDARAALIAPLLLALCSYHSLWAYLGLEPTAFGLCILAAFYHLDRRTAGSSTAKACVWAALAYLFRPEGGLVVIAVAAVTLRRHRNQLRRVLLPLVMLASVVMGHELFRLAYYGDVVPNTFHAKASISRETLLHGLAYILDFALHSVATELVVLGTLLGVLTRTRPSIPADSDRAFTIVLYVYLAYIALVGGDYMGASRFCVPLVPMLVVFTCRIGIPLARRAEPAARVAIASALIVYVALSTKALVRELAATSDGDITRIGYMQQYVEDRLRVGRWLRLNVDGPYRITGSAMGVIPWHLMHAHVIDARGLTDRTVARTAPVVSSRAGHARFATDEYLLAQRPELLMHRYAICADRALNASVRRLATPGYHAVCVAVPGMHAADWFCFAKRNDVALDLVGVPPPGAEVARVDATGRVSWSP